MSFFENARQIAFLALQEADTVSIIDKREKEMEGFPTDSEIWKLVTEMAGEGGMTTEVTLFANVPADFPLSVPSIYLSRKSYDKIGILPHVDSNRLICTFDTELSRADPNNPEGIMVQCIAKAKRILEQGIAGTNLQDFEEEFLAYWACNYGKNDSHREDVLCLFGPEDSVSKISVIKLEQPFGSVNYILHKEDVAALNFISFLEDKKMKFREMTAFWCGAISIDFKPPFDCNNAWALDIVTGMATDRQKEFQRFINSQESPKLTLAIVKVKDKQVLIGWSHRKLKMEYPGFRNGTITPYQALSTFQKNDKLIRITPEIFTNERFYNRSAGNSFQREYRFAVVGLGSVGSHLVHLLNTMNFPELRLVDTDFLNAENAGRHLLGLNYFGRKKSIALKDMLRLKNPAQTIHTREKSVVDLLQNEPTFLNNCDVVFMATGKTNIETWIGKAIQDNVINKPVFFIWVEPFLCAGHCLYIFPGSTSYEQYFSTGGMFRYNIIEAEYYGSIGSELVLKEAGCQTSYVPYSGSSMVSFLGALFPQLVEIIESPDRSSQAYTWVGNIRELNKRSIPVSDYYKDKQEGQLIKHIQ